MNDGVAAENLAATFLQQQGLTLVEKNYRCRFGEIDLIMRDGATVVFAEVRLRQNQQFGGAAASITPTKQARLIATAQHYLSSLNRTPACRFDAVLLQGLVAPKIEWIKNAFDA